RLTSFLREGGVLTSIAVVLNPALVRCFARSPSKQSPSFQTQPHSPKPSPQKPPLHPHPGESAHPECSTGSAASSPDNLHLRMPHPDPPAEDKSPPLRTNTSPSPIGDP